MKASFESRQPCEQTSLRNIESMKVKGYDASLHLLICTKEKQTGKGQFTLIQGIRARDALYVIQRAWRGPAYATDVVPLPQAEFKTWRAFMNAVQVCDPRVAERACPASLKRVQ